MTGTLHEDQYTLLIISRSFILRIKNVSDKCCRESRNTHFLFNNFFSENRNDYENVEKYCRAGQATDDDNMTHVHCVLDTSGYRHILRLCNTHCFSTATMVARSRLSVTLYVHCLPCFITYRVLPVVYVKNQLPNLRVFASVKFYVVCVKSVCWHQNSLRVTT
jgi:hypothetical protein